MQFTGWIFHEIRLRKVKAAVIYMVSFIAVTLFCGTFLVFREYDVYLKERFRDKHAELEKDMHAMWDSYRKMTKKLGFNVLILPKEQNLSDFYAENFASQYMPQWYADTLAQSKSVVVQHILPTLMQKVMWPERKRTVLVYGVQKEKTRIHFPKANKRMPILQAVHTDSLVLGYELWKGFSLSRGDSVSFMNRHFFISKCHEKRGDRDDITIWINLSVAQDLFSKPAQINAILALECRCTVDKNLSNLAKIRQDLSGILPNTQVVEFMSEVLARAEARYGAVKTREEALQQEESYAEKMKTRQFIISASMVGTCLVGVFVCIVILTIIDTRNRRYEIGLLLSLGFEEKIIIILFLDTIIILSLLGSCSGCIAAFIVAQGMQTFLFQNTSLLSIPNYLFGIVMVSTPIMLSVSALLPILHAVRIEPSCLLREDM